MPPSRCNQGILRAPPNCPKSRWTTETIAYIRSRRQMNLRFACHHKCNRGNFQVQILMAFGSDTRSLEELRFGLLSQGQDCTLCAYGSITGWTWWSSQSRWSCRLLGMSRVFCPLAIQFSAHEEFEHGYFCFLKEMRTWTSFVRNFCSRP